MQYAFRRSHQVRHLQKGDRHYSISSSSNVANIAQRAKNVKVEFKPLLGMLFSQVSKEHSSSYTYNLTNLSGCLPRVFIQDPSVVQFCNVGSWSATCYLLCLMLWLTFFLLRYAQLVVVPAHLVDGNY